MPVYNPATITMFNDNYLYFCVTSQLLPAKFARSVCNNYYSNFPIGNVVDPSVYAQFVLDKLLFNSSAYESMKSEVVFKSIIQNNLKTC